MFLDSGLRRNDEVRLLAPLPLGEGEGASPLAAPSPKGLLTLPVHAGPSVP